MEALLSKNHPRSGLKSLIAILCAACFLTFAQGAVTHALAAEDMGNLAEEIVRGGSGRGRKGR